MVDGQALGHPGFGGAVDVIAVEGGPPIVGSGPPDRISDDFQDIGMAIYRIGFVAGLEIKDFARAAPPAAAGAEQLPAAEPASEHQLVRPGKPGAHLAVAADGISKNSPYISSIGSSTFIGIPLAIG